jgi:formylglycine-generating enzyme required for sulfatase activity
MVTTMRFSGRVLAGLLTLLLLAASGGAFAAKAGATFRDCPECPEMVVLPAGTLQMGSLPDEALRSDQEGPQHKVTIPHPFAVAVHDVTRDEYARFVRETGRQSAPDCLILTPTAAVIVGGADWRSPGFAQTGRDPVVCVDWNDAQAYASWLNTKPRRAKGAGRYRLLTEAEWEYAARAGTTGRFYWGDDAEAACHFANVADQAAHRLYASIKTADCDDRYAATSPVGSFPPNPFGLYDIVGDAFQWVEDCYHPNYDGAPTDGSAWTAANCEEHVIRGGSFGHMPRLARSAYRFKDTTDHRSVFLGFRLARDAE